jgi:serine/threonine-protein kinase
MAPVGATAAYAEAKQESTQRSPWFWVLLTLGVLAVGVATLFVGRAIFGTPAVEKVATPNVVGLTITEAQATLAAQGLVLGTQTPQSSTTVPKDAVISQNPPATQQIDKGTRVDITVSTGKDQSTVPNLVGLSTEDDARSALLTAGLTLGTVKQVDSAQPLGFVVAQNPAAGATVDAGAAVAISVSNGKSKVPDVVGESEAQAKSDLINAGFDVNVATQVTDSKPEGTVLAQSPKAGASAVKGTLVTITVAKAPPPPTPTPTPTPTTSGAASPSP